MTTVGIVGLGLIGASLARRFQLDERIALRCVDTDQSTRLAASQHGLRVVASLEELVNGPLDVVFVATPMPALDGVFGEIARLAAGRDLVVVDTGSVKGPVLQLARRSFSAGPRFLGGHPMAGTEGSGFAAASPELFDGSVWVLCVEADSDRRDFVSVARLLTGTGIGVVPLSAGDHDEAVARISHLPHVIAVALSTLVGTHSDSDLLYRLTAGSLRSATRVAGARPGLTAEMCTANSASVLDAVDEFVEACRRLQDGLRRSGDDVKLMFEEGHRYHRRIGGAREAVHWTTRELAIGLDGGPFDNAARDDLLAVGRSGGAVTRLHVDESSRRCILTCTVPPGAADHPIG